MALHMKPAASCQIRRRQSHGALQPGLVFLELLQALTAQHQALMQAILDGDPQRARACIGEHLEHVRTTIQRMDEDRARRERSMRLPLDLAPQDLRQPPP